MVSKALRSKLKDTNKKNETLDMIEMNANWTIQDRLDIIRKFKPYPQPTFVGTEDAVYAVTWMLYNRICENIKSFTILFENNQFCDAFIIAGVALETCAKLSFIKDRESVKLSQKCCNKYLASIIVSQLIYNLSLEDNLQNELSWKNFECFLRIFYPVGNLIFKNKNETYEGIISKINYRLGDNKNKISLLKKSFKEMPVSCYTNFFFEKLKIYEETQEMGKYYKKYCSLKHSNIMTPGVFFEGNEDPLSIAMRNNLADDSLYLVLGLVMYLENSEKLFI